MGAWIETNFERKIGDLYESHPTWVRGLKLATTTIYGQQGQNVASYMGAWIETSQVIGIVRQTKSHPTWVRGLKHCDIKYIIY